MTWGLAEFVKRLVVSAFSSWGCGATAPSIGLRGPAPNTAPRLTPDGDSTLRLIERRALRKSGNTDRATMANYRRVHSILSRGG